jgi:hypothetical protein
MEGQKRKMDNAIVYLSTITVVILCMQVLTGKSRRHPLTCSTQHGGLIYVSRYGLDERSRPEE